MFDCSSLNERRLKAGNMGYLLAARTRRWGWCIIARLPLAALLGALLVVGPLTIPFAHAASNVTVNTCPGTTIGTINRCAASEACPGDPQDIITFNNVTEGNYLTIEVRNSGDIDPTNVVVVRNGGPGSDPSPASLSLSLGATGTAGYTVQATDGTDARFMIKLPDPQPMT